MTRLQAQSSILFPSSFGLETLATLNLKCDFAQVLERKDLGLCANVCVVAHGSWVCGCMQKPGRMVSVLFYCPPAYSLEAGSLTQPGAWPATSQPQ